ncbi:MAG: aminopeptidase, partial [Verrucomicrobiota bacterium]
MLTSTHLERWARLLAEYAVEARAGQVVRISAQPAGEPLLEAVYRAVLETGAHPIVRMQPESLEEIFYDVANEAQLDWENPFNAYETERIDASINIRTSINLRAMDHVDPARSQRAARARAGERSLFFDRAALADAPELAPGGSPLRWSMTQFPTNAYAQFAGMSLKEYEGFVVKACQLDQPDPIAFWQSLDAWQIQLAEVLNGGRELHFKAPTGTDLRVAVDGMRWLSSPGRKNFPDGEVYSGPNLKADNGGAEGVVVFDRSTVYQGHRVSDVRIRMEQGRATEVTAGEGEAFLVKMLDQDEGARRI